MVVGVLFCGNAPVCLGVWISPRWKNHEEFKIKPQAVSTKLGLRHRCVPVWQQPKTYIAPGRTAFRMPKWALLTGMDTSWKTETLWGELKTRVPARRPLDLEKNGLWLENECEKQTTAGCYPAKTDSSVWLLASVGLIILTLVVLAFVTFFFSVCKVKYASKVKLGRLEKLC